jgi:hypothetical protein
MGWIVAKGFSQQVAASAKPSQLAGFDGPVYQVIAALLATFNDSRQLGIRKYPVGQIQLYKLLR